MGPSNRRRNIEREERLVLRLEREGAAGKLLQKVPALTSLSLTIHQVRADGLLSDAQYIRRIVLAHAPALFEMPCSSTYCKDGGYDVTQEVLAALLLRTTHFEGKLACRGSAGTGDCNRVLRYVGTATYTP